MIIQKNIIIIQEILTNIGIITITLQLDNLI